MTINIRFYDGMGYGITRPIVVVNFPNINKINNNKLYALLKKYNEFSNLENFKSSNVYETILYLVKFQYEIARIPSFNNFVALQKEGSYAFDYYHKNAFQIALNTSLQLLDNFSKNKELLFEKLDESIVQLRTFVDSGVNNYRILQAASQKNIPFRNLTKDIFALGYGKNSICFKSTITSNTNPLFPVIAKNKIQTKLFLRERGLPVAPFGVVENIKELKEIAQKLGYPVVVKPFDKDQGLGVYNGIKDEKTLLWAYNETLKVSKNVMVEKHIDGDDYRINLYNGHILSIS